MQNVRSVTTQSFNEGSLNTRNVCLIVYQDVAGSHQSEKNLLLNESLITHGHTHCESNEGQRNGWPFASRVLPNILRWYFLACLLPRSGEIKVEVINRRRHCKAALRRNGDSMPVRVYLLKQKLLKNYSRARFGFRT